MASTLMGLLLRLCWSGAALEQAAPTSAMSTWTRGITIDGVGGLLAMEHQDGRCIGRDISRVVGFGRGRDVVDWEVALGDDHWFGYKGLRWLDDGAFVMARHEGGDPRTVILECREGATGELRWTRPLGWAINDNYGGLQRLGADIVVVERAETGPQLSVLSSEDGLTLATHPCAHVSSAASMTYGIQTALSLRGALYCCGGGPGITRVTRSGDGLVLDTLGQGRFGQLFVWGAQLGAVAYDGAFAAVRLTADGEVAESVPLANPPAAIRQWPGLGLLVVERDGEGLQLARDGATQWSIDGGDEEPLVTNAVATAAGVVVVGELGREPVLHLLSRDEGAFLPVPPSWLEAGNHPVFLLDDTLWIELPDGLTAFTVA